jgi:hypothetical protein
MSVRSQKVRKIVFAVFVCILLIVAVAALVMFDTTGRSGNRLSDEFQYDIEKLGNINKELILYEEFIPPFKTGFSESRAIAVDVSGRIYVAGDREVRVFDEHGSKIVEADVGGTPGCLTVDNDGDIYVGLRNHVEVYGEQLTRKASWQELGEKAVLTSIDIYKSDVFVADAGNRVVWRYDKTGQVVGEIGKKDEDRNIPGFVVPSPYFDLAVAKDGLLRVVNPGWHRIEAYTFDGDLELWWGESSNSIKGFCGCCNPVNFTIMEDGSFVTCEKGLLRVKIYDPQGNFVCVVAGPEQLLGVGDDELERTFGISVTQGFDVAVDQRGHVYVLDTINNEIKIFSKIEDTL